MVEFDLSLKNLERPSAVMAQSPNTVPQRLDKGNPFDRNQIPQPWRAVHLRIVWPLWINPIFAPMRRRFGAYCVPL
jgi:hypothetical protein